MRRQANASAKPKELQPIAQSQRFFAIFNFTPKPPISQDNYERLIIIFRKIKRFVE
jgi:hypothetical protein